MKFPLFFAAVIFVVSGYIFWPVWQEISGRAVDREMTEKTDKAIGEKKIDQSYVNVARATGGSVCSAAGSTLEEKNENLQKCFAAFNHRELKKNKDSLIRQRFLEVKTYAQGILIPLTFVLWTFLFFVVLAKKLASPALVTLVSILPGLLFWIIVGGPMAIIHPELYGRGGFHLPLFGALCAGIILFVWQKRPLFQVLSKGRKYMIIVGVTLSGLIPTGFILLLAGSC